MEKRGQGLSTTAIILIVIGVILLVVLVIGFSVGWGKLAPFISNSNVNSISTQCSTACITKNVYGFCTKARDLNDGSKKLKGVTCYYLAEKQPGYGIAKCPDISNSCNVIFVSATSVDDLKTKCSGNEGSTVEALIDGELQSYFCS